jgi:hypothetical protein
MCARVLRTAERAIEFIDTPYLAVRRPSEARRHREDKHLCEEKSPDLVRRYLQRERQRAVVEARTFKYAEDDDVTSTRTDDVTSTRTAPCPTADAPETFPAPPDADWVRVLATVEADPPPSWRAIFRRYLGI